MTRRPRNDAACRLAARTFQHFGGWLNTGDLGREDAQGYFWLTGRKKELIIRGGHNIDPKAIQIVPALPLNKPIAAELWISEVTVKVHRGQVLRKMRARSLADLVRMADRLVPIPKS